MHRNRQLEDDENDSTNVGFDGIEVEEDAEGEESEDFKHSAVSIRALSLSK